MRLVVFYDLVVPKQTTCRVTVCHQSRGLRLKREPRNHRLSFVAKFGVFCTTGGGGLLYCQHLLRALRYTHTMVDTLGRHRTHESLPLAAPYAIPDRMNQRRTGRASAPLATPPFYPLHVSCLCPLLRFFLFSFASLLFCAFASATESRLWFCF